MHWIGEIDAVLGFGSAFLLLVLQSRQPESREVFAARLAWIVGNRDAFHRYCKGIVFVEPDLRLAAELGGKIAELRQASGIIQYVVENQTQAERIAQRLMASGASGDMATADRHTKNRAFREIDA
jgi:hypothetical protein